MALLPLSRGSWERESDTWVAWPVVDHLGLVGLGDSGHAGLFRAYLSISGNDANPCTVQEPCRLLPAALNAVNDAGEIWMLDSANYNTSTVSITKSVSILAVPGAVGSVVANGGDAISINAPGSRVALRNLNVRPLSGSANGISVATVLHLFIDHAVFENLSSAVRGAAAVVNITDSVFRANTTGLKVSQSGGASLVISIDRASYIDNTTSMSVNTTAFRVCRLTVDSVISGTDLEMGRSLSAPVAGGAPIVASHEY
jgi:hypothetical protein